MNPTGTPIVAIVALAFAVLAVSACGASELDVGKAEKTIDTAVRTQVGARVESVTCPPDVPIEAQATFTCTVVGADGSDGEATVTQRDDEGNVSVDAPFLHVREAERVIAAELRKDKPGAKVRCPEIVVAAKGATFECASASGEIAVRQTDDEGRFSYKVRPG